MTVPKLAEIRKAAVAGCTLLAELVATGVLHGTVLHVAQAVLAGAGTYGVYRVENAPKP